MNYFADSPAQSRVVNFLLENGFGVNDEGYITCNGIAIPATHIARAIGTDRRVVEATGQRILRNEILKKIFINIRVTPDLSKVADSLGLSVITILPKNAQEKGIVGSAIQILHNHNLSIRQIFVTDPYINVNPKLVIIIDEPLPKGVIEELRALPQIKSIIF